MMMSSESKKGIPSTAVPFRRRFWTLLILKSQLLCRSVRNWLLVAGVIAMFVAGAMVSVGADTSSVVRVPLLALEANHSAVSRFWLRIFDLSTLFLPFLAFLCGYGSIHGGSGRGNLTCLGSLPLTRGEIYLATVVAHLAAFAIVLATGTAIGILTMMAFGASGSLIRQFGTGFLTISLGLALIAPGIGLSALASTRKQGILGIIGGGFAMVYGIPFLLARRSVFIILHPFQSYAQLLTTQVEAAYSPLIQLYSPQLLSPFVAVAVLAGWVCCPITLGYLCVRNEVIG